MACTDARCVIACSRASLPDGSAVSSEAGSEAASCNAGCVLLQRRLIEAPEEDESGPATSAKLQTLRLTREEMGFKTIPLVPGLNAATAADLQALPEVRQSGSFSAFTLVSTNPKQQWVVSPRGRPCPSQMPLTRMPCLSPSTSLPAHAVPVRASYMHMSTNGR